VSLPRTTALMAAAAGLLLAAPPVLAADRGESTPIDLPSSDGQAAATGGGGGSMLRTIVGLAIVLAVIYGLYWVLKQVKASRDGSASGRGLETLATVPLGTGRSVHLVRAGSEIVLLGVSEGAVVPIRTYSEDEAYESGLLELPGSTEAAAVTPAGPPSPAVALRDLVDRLQRRTVRS
jgi:flagellar protein FliO/FliZ